MSYQYSTISYSGLTLDVFLTDDQLAYITLTSLAKGLGVHRQTVADWLKYHCKPQYTPLDVKVGKFNKAAHAHPVDIAVEFIDHLADKGHVEAKALRSSTLSADITRSIKEANGVQVTAAQHEENRAATRLALIEKWVADTSKGGTVAVGVDMIKAAGFTDLNELNAAYWDGMVLRRTATSENLKDDRFVINECKRFAQEYKDKVAQGVKCPQPTFN